VSGREGVVSVDQTAIRGSRRSNPATYTGLPEPIRKAFAKANGVKPALFSANSEGACPSCNGARGRNIAEALDLSVEDAVGFFGAGKARTPDAHAILQRMAAVGLAAAS
jgi:excinuclease UvrABC ATPase subunit